jgi:hypothetical protein
MSNPPKALVLMLMMAVMAGCERNPSSPVSPVTPTPPCQSTLTLETNLPAHVFVDGEAVGDTPLHELALKKSGLQKVRLVSISDGQEHELSLNVGKCERILKHENFAEHKPIEGAAPTSKSHWEAVNVGVPLERFTSVWGAEGQVWLLGSKQLETVVMNWNGTRWQTQQTFTGQGNGVIGGRTPNDLWIVGSFSRHAANGGQFEQAGDLVNSRGVHALTEGANNILWAVGNKGEILHQSGDPKSGWMREEVGPMIPAYKGGRTSPVYRNEVPTGTVRANLNGIWVSPTGSDLFAVGDAGTVLHKHGDDPWEIEKTPTHEDLRGVWGWSPNDVWAAGDAGTLMRRLTGEWTVVESGVQTDLYGLFGTGPSEVWAVGGRGTLLHFDGADWKSEPTATQELILALWGNGQGEVWAVGDNSTVLHRVVK